MGEKKEGIDGCLGWIEEGKKRGIYAETWP